MQKEMPLKPNIVLFGPPGVGKSTAGEVLRDEFSFTFYDGDDEMTPTERELVSKGLWGDKERKVLLVRMGNTINRLYASSEVGLVTSVALTCQWMRDFLNIQTHNLLQFVLVKSTLQNNELEKLIAKRRESGHAITVESFRKFTAAFEQPTIPHLTLKNPQDHHRREELIQNIRNVLDQLKK